MTAENYKLKTAPDFIDLQKDCEAIQEEIIRLNAEIRRITAERDSLAADRDCALAIVVKAEAERDEAQVSLAFAEKVIARLRCQVQLMLAEPKPLPETDRL